MRQLTPLPLRDLYWHPIELEISRILTLALFQPLARLFKKEPDELLNTGSALLQAIQQGTVWYADGHFSGEYNSHISRDLRAIGALYNTKSRTWSLVRDLLPVDIRIAQAHADQRYSDLRRSFLTTLDDLNIDSINRISEIPDKYMQTIDWMENDFQKSVKAISIPPKLTAEQRGIITADWSQNLDLYVKGWEQNRIIEMRDKVQANAFDGRRASELYKMLQDQYGVTLRKARFLARQETSLLLSKFRETRYRDIGSNRYRWSTSHDERVRHDHKDLNGKIFNWDMPPVTNRKTGKRNNPGEDFGCRCTAIPIFD